MQESALEKVAQPLLVDLLNLDLASDQTWTLDQLQSLAFALPPLKKGDALEAVSQLSDLLDEAVYRKVESRFPVLERHALCADIVRSLATEVHVLGTRLRMANNLPVKRLSQMKWIEVVPETEGASFVLIPLGSSFADQEVSRCCATEYQCGRQSWLRRPSQTTDASFGHCTRQYLCPACQGWCQTQSRETKCW